MKPLLIGIVNALVIILILDHVHFHYISGSHGDSHFSVLLFLLSTLFFLNTILYIQFYIFDHLALSRFQRRFLLILFMLIIILLIIFR